MNISIIGSGRVGVSLGAVLADSGFSVLMTDKEDKKQEVFGRLSFYETHLSKYLEESQSHLEWTRWTEKIVSSELIFFCLGFPVKKNGDLDLTELFNWARYIVENTKESKILVIKSTVPVGTNRQIQNIIGDKKIAVISCPEFLREGQAIGDLIQPQRIVIGARDKEAGKKLEELYKKISQPKQIVHTDPETAELSKLACNSFLATKISFINEMAGLCEKTQADIEKLRLILGLDSRIGKDFLNPGLGYGGYCLPKDVQLAISEGEKRNQNMELLKTAQKINSSLVNHFFKGIKNHYRKLNNISLVFWGISFKKDTDNLTNSPALKLACKLLKSGVKIHVYDPVFVKEQIFKLFRDRTYPQAENPIKDVFLKIFPPKNELDYLIRKIFEGKCHFHKSALDSLDNRQGLIIGSDWEEFKKIPLEEIKQRLSDPFIVDGRSLLLTEDLKKNKFSFYKRGAVT
ncbi:MAG: nucleotide sugar dehydrogenase [Oligoflexia bacterium]|nr:nucleotide sugar dehydrogenase [Oligoflexia bacterium]